MQKGPGVSTPGQTLQRKQDWRLEEQVVDLKGVTSHVQEPVGRDCDWDHVAVSGDAPCFLRKVPKGLTSNWL